MNNNGMIEYKESIISKIKNFFKNIFRTKDVNDYYMQNESIKELKQEKNNFQNKFIDNIKVEQNVTNDIFKRNKFLKEIDGNKDALNMLSIDRLKKLEKYYDSIIEQNNQKIKKLKASA